MITALDSRTRLNARPNWEDAAMTFGKAYACAISPRRCVNLSSMGSAAPGDILIGEAAIGL